MYFSFFGDYRFQKQMKKITCYLIMLDESEA